MQPTQDSEYKQLPSAAIPWPRGFRPLLDLLFVVSLLLTYFGIAAVFAFHVAFAAMTVAAFAYSGRGFLIRVVPGVAVITAVVAIAVDRGILQVDELYEVPILVIMMGFAAWSVQQHQRLFQHLRRQSDRLLQLHEAGQVEYREQLLLAQRRETFGQLSAGVAHNLRNLLTTVVSEAERIEDQTENSDEAAAARRIQAHTQRGAELISDMLHHTRPHGDDEYADLAEAVRSEQSSLEILVGPGIDLRFEVDDGPLLVPTTRSMVEQVVINLVLNAKDAVGASGTIMVSATEELSHGDEQDRSAVLTVKDSGGGMSEEVRQRAFEPFFTTKSDRDSAGLGLYTTLMIAEDAGGTVRVAGGDGELTTITVSLPIADLGADAPVKPRRTELRLDDLIGTERVLVVDDDDVMRDRLCNALHLHGYSVTPASNGNDGLATLSNESFDLVVTDIVMPEMDGPTMILEARHQGLLTQPVLFVSAHDNAADLIPSDAALLAKPFSRNIFLAHVRRTVEAGTS